MADLHGDRVSHLLVDARPVDHPTARNRGIGRYTIGLLSGLQQVGAPVVALYETDTEAGVLAAWHFSDGARPSSGRTPCPAPGTSPRS